MIVKEGYLVEKLDFNMAILNEILNDKEATNELKDYLNSVIDEEIAKGDNADCDLIDNCINAIYELTEGTSNSPYLIALASEKSFVNEIRKKSILQKGKYKKLVAICASVAILFAIGNTKTASGQTVAKKIANNIASTFGIDLKAEEKEEITTQKIETEITEATEKPTEAETEPTTKSTLVAKSQSAKESTTKATVLESIYGVASKNLKTDYILGEKLDLNGLKLFAVYSDDTEEQIPFEKCTVSVPKKFATDVGIYKITIAYQNKEYSYNVKVYAEKTSVVLNSIYGTFPDDFTFTTDSFENIDMSVVKVTAVFSDGSEKNIPISKCDVTIEENFMEIENKALVTVTYEERAFSFVMTKEVI